LSQILARALRAGLPRYGSELLATARERGQQRLVEMNEPVELNLVRVIDDLETAQEGRLARGC